MLPPNSCVIEDPTTHVTTAHCQAHCTKHKDRSCLIKILPFNMDKKSKSLFVTKSNPY